MTVGGEEIVAGPGDIVVIEPDVPHRFTAIGDEKLFAVAVHASDRFIIEWLGDEGPDTPPRGIRSGCCRHTRDRMDHIVSIRSTILTTVLAASLLQQLSPRAGELRRLRRHRRRPRDVSRNAAARDRRRSSSSRERATAPRTGARSSIRPTRRTTPTTTPWPGARAICTGATRRSFPRWRASPASAPTTAPDVRLDGTGPVDAGRPAASGRPGGGRPAPAADGCAGEPGPYVLVPHSYGGVVATLFARTWPDEVAGLVMVDAVTPLMREVASPEAVAKWDALNQRSVPEAPEAVMLLDAFAQDRCDGAAAPDAGGGAARRQAVAAALDPEGGARGGRGHLRRVAGLGGAARREPRRQARSPRRRAVTTSMPTRPRSSSTPFTRSSTQCGTARPVWSEQDQDIRRRPPVRWPETPRQREASHASPPRRRTVDGPARRRRSGGSRSRPTEPGSSTSATVARCSSSAAAAARRRSCSSPAASRRAGSGPTRSRPTTRCTTRQTTPSRPEAATRRSSTPRSFRPSPSSPGSASTTARTPPSATTSPGNAAAWSPRRSRSRTGSRTTSPTCYALLEAAGEPSPYVLVAHSYGGMIAELFARRYPARGRR